MAMLWGSCLYTVGINQCPDTLLPDLSVPKDPFLHGALGTWGHLSPPLRSSQNQELLLREPSFSFPNKSPEETAPFLVHRIPSLSPGSPVQLGRVLFAVGNVSRTRWGLGEGEGRASVPTRRDGLSTLGIWRGSGEWAVTGRQRGRDLPS